MLRLKEQVKSDQKALLRDMDAIVGNETVDDYDADTIIVNLKVTDRL